MIFIFFFFSSISFYYCQLPKCRSDSLKFIFSKCNENLQRSIFFTNPEQCDIFSEQIPVSNENMFCSSCDNGFYLSYNMKTNNFTCNICPKNTYSIKGNFRVNGDYYEWNQKVIDSFQNDCFLSNLLNENYYCTRFHTENGKKLISGNPHSKNYSNLTYVVQLGKTFRLIENGQIKFKYKKDTFKEENSTNGIFKFFINYMIQYIDDEISSSKNEYNEIAFNLTPGYYSFLWQYSKKIKNIKDENLKIVFKTIEITGLETAALECQKCLNGFSNEGSDHCEVCKDEKYYDSKTSSCLNCPNNTRSKGGIGIESCVEYPQCIDDDYIQIIDNKCDIFNNKQKISFKLINDKCNEKIKKNDIYIDCFICESGLYKKKIDNTHYICDYCPPYTFSNESNKDNCLTCEGYIKRRMIFNYLENNTFNQKIEIEKNEGELNIELNNKNKSEMTLFIDNEKIYKRPDENNVIKIKLLKGPHNIFINLENFQIKKIIIYNTTEGGGYECEECPENAKIKNENGFTCLNCGPGYYLNSQQNCVKCDYNFIKMVSGNNEKCIKCPDFTFSNDERTECLIYPIINQKNIKRSFIIEQFEKTQEKICKLLDCTNSLLPINDMINKKIYYISFNSSRLFPFNDKKYSFQNSDIITKKGYIYLLIHSSFKDKGTIFNIGNKIEQIKIIDEENEKGIVIKYIGDECPDIPDKKYESYLFLRCKKNEIEDTIFSFQKPILIKSNKCSHYFKWDSLEACPICLSNEIKEISSFCVKSKKNIFNSEGDKCIIQNPNTIYGNEIEFDSNDNVVNENDIEIANNYVFSVKSNRKYPNNKIKLVTEKKYQNSCSMSSNYDIFSIIYIVIGIIVYILLLLIIFIVYFKSHKLRNTVSEIQIVKIHEKEKK